MSTTLTMTDAHAAFFRERATLLRNDSCAQAVLRALNCCPLSAPQLARMYAARYRPRTIRGALQRLKLAGLAKKTGRKVWWDGGVAERWGVV